MRLVIYNSPSELARRLARELVDNEVSPCVNSVTGVTRTVLGEEGVEEHEETLLLIHTVPENLESVIDLILEVDPSEAPGILALPILAGDPGYLELAEGLPAGTLTAEAAGGDDDDEIPF